MAHRKIMFYKSPLILKNLKNKAFALYKIITYRAKVKFFLFSTLFFLLSGCSCGCVYTVPDLDTNYTTAKSNVTVFADGCSAMNGSVNSDGVTPLNCASGGTAFQDRGRWVKLPKIGATKNSTLVIDIYGSVFFCSSGYDNKNPSPKFTVNPATLPKTTFNDGTEMVVKEGEIIIIENLGDGVVIGNEPNNTTCTNNSAGYQKLKLGYCKGTNALGLTIYVDNSEIVTLDNTTTAAGSGTQINSIIDTDVLQYSIARQPNIYSSTTLPPMSGTGGVDFQDVLNEYNTKYQTTLTKGYGHGKYQFIVPKDSTGKLGFSIAQAAGSNIGNGSGEYILEVLSTPMACFVDGSQAINKPGQRGALQLLISSANPNNIDNALNAFDSLPTTEIDAYYSQLLNYIKQVASITIESDAGILSNLVTPDIPSISPIVINGSYYSGTPNNSGDIWFKVRDDYYHDNVGHYEAYVSVITKKNSQVSEFLMSLTVPVIKLLGTASTTIYNNFYESNDFLQLVRLSLVLYIILYGLFFTLGLTSISAQDLVIRVIKIAVVTQLFSPNSWQFFNSYFFSVFTEGSEFLIGAATGDTSPDKVNLFGFVDDAFNVFFQDVTWIKISVLIFDLVGFITIFIIVYIILVYLFVLARVLITYLLTVLALAILISLAPLFIVFILFQRTKKYFDGWVSYLVDYALQSVFLFVAFYIVSTIFVTMWTNMMSYEVCWGGVDMHPLQVDLSILSSWAGFSLPKVNLGCFQWFVFKGSNSFYSIFIQATSLAIMVCVIRGIIGHISDITRAITGTSASSGLDSTVASVQKDAVDTAKAAPKAIAMALIEKGMQWYDLGGSMKGMFKGRGGGGSSTVSSGSTVKTSEGSGPSTKRKGAGVGK